MKLGEIITLLVFGVILVAYIVYQHGHIIK